MLHWWRFTGISEDRSAFYALPGPEEGCSIVLRNFGNLYVLSLQKRIWGAQSV